MLKHQAAWSTSLVFSLFRGQTETDADMQINVLIFSFSPPHLFFLLLCLSVLVPEFHLFSLGALCNQINISCWTTPFPFVMLSIFFNPTIPTTEISHPVWRPNILLSERQWDLRSLPLHSYPTLCLVFSLSSLLFIYLPVYLWVCLSICLSVSPSVYLSISLSVCLSLHLPVCLSVYISPSVSLSVYRFLWLSIYISPSMSVCLCPLYFELKSLKFFREFMKEKAKFSILTCTHTHTTLQFSSLFVTSPLKANHMLLTYAGFNLAENPGVIKPLPFFPPSSWIYAVQNQIIPNSKQTRFSFALNRIIGEKISLSPIKTHRKTA